MSPEERIEKYIQGLNGLGQKYGVQLQTQVKIRWEVEDDVVQAKPTVTLLPVPDPNWQPNMVSQEA